MKNGQKNGILITEPHVMGGGGKDTEFRSGFDKNPIVCMHKTFKSLKQINVPINA